MGDITPSVIAYGDATLPLLSPAVTSSPGRGKSALKGTAYCGDGKVSGSTQRLPLGGAVAQRLKG